MSWTTPVDRADGYVVTGADWNAVQDNLSYLYTHTASPTTSAQVASYTLVLGDANNIVEISNASANTLTVPPNSSVAFPVGTSVTFIQTGAGQTTLTPGAGVTINATPGLKVAAQWGAVTLLKRATDTWVAMGNLTT